MFEDKVQEMIKEEVARVISGLMTEERLKEVVSKAITKAFEPLARKQEIVAQEYITAKQVEELFPISSATLKTWRARKIPGPPYSRVGDRVIYKLSDLYAFFDQHKIGINI